MLMRIRAQPLYTHQFDRHLGTVGRGQQVVVQQLGMLGWPRVGDGFIGEIGHKDYFTFKAKFIFVKAEFLYYPS